MSFVRYAWMSMKNLVKAGYTVKEVLFICCIWPLEQFFSFPAQDLLRFSERW
jgi:hypothetical protein